VLVGSEISSATLGSFVLYGFEFGSSGKEVDLSPEMIKDVYQCKITTTRWMAYKNQKLQCYGTIIKKNQKPSYPTFTICLAKQF
jgi:hypothetical protein